MSDKVPTLHVEGGDCWCDSWRDVPCRREAALDLLYPDRCRLRTEPESPNPTAGHAWCIRLAGHDGGCAGHLDRPGAPCHFCGQPTPEADADGNIQSCLHCWKDLTSMAVADVKALFAASWPEAQLEHKIEGRL